MTEDEVSNMIYGIKQIHDMRMEKLFEVFRKVHKLDEYCDDPEKLAAREHMKNQAIQVAKQFEKLQQKKGKKKCHNQ